MNYRVAQILRFMIILLFIFVVLGLFYLGIRAIGNGLRSSSSSNQAQQQVKIDDFAKSGSKARLINDGPIVAPEDHIVTTVTVTATQRTIDVSKGYNQPPVTSQSFANNEASYTSFLSALDSAGFTQQKQAPIGISRTGSCPLGSRYSYQLIAENGSLRIDSWNNSCGNRQGTIAGNANLIRSLFQRQIPNYSTIVSSVD